MAIEFPVTKLNEWNKGEYVIHATHRYASVVILGEYHYQEHLINRQLELIDLVNPEFVLHEFASGFVYNPTTRLWTRQADRRFDDSLEDKKEWEIDPEFLKHASKLGYTIVGSDMTLQEQRDLVDKLSENDQDLDDIMSAVDADLIAERDARMVTTITEYRGLTRFPLVAVMGATHAKNIHELGLLAQKRISYAIVDQSTQVK